MFVGFSEATKHERFMNFSRFFFLFFYLFLSIFLILKLIVKFSVFYFISNYEKTKKITTSIEARL